jgi:RNA polymerase sigma-70 factor (ECF subfamily)
MGNREDKFARLWLQAVSDLHAFAAARIGGPHGVEDVLQDTALAAWQQFEKYEPNRSFSGWARGIAKHKIADHQRRRARQSWLSYTDKAEYLVERYERSECACGGRTETLREALAKLKPRDQHLLELHYWQGLALNEIAVQMNLPGSTVRNRHTRALALLRKYLATSP